MPKAALSPSRAIGYLRVSTVEQTLGRKAQRDALEKWCGREGVELMAVFEDDGVSGGADLEDRPGVLAAIQALREHGAGLFLVAKRDRLARDRVMAGLIEQLVRRAGARVASADGVQATDAPESQLLVGILDLFAEFERGLIRARTKAALQAKRTRQERVGGIGWGWKLGADGVHVEPDPAERKVIALVRGLAGRGLSLREIAQRLDRRGIRSRRGGRLWPQSIRALLAAS